MFRALEPLPSAVADLLATKPKVGGKVGIRWCSAVKPREYRSPGRDPRAPAAERLPRTGGPAGLPVAQEPLEPRQLRPRCQDLGFEVTSL